MADSIPSFVLTVQSLRNHRGEYLGALLAELATSLGRVPSDNEPIPFAVWFGLPSVGAELRLWLLRRTPCRDEILLPIVAFAERCAARSDAHAQRVVAHTGHAARASRCAQNAAYFAKNAARLAHVYTASRAAGSTDYYAYGYAIDSADSAAGAARRAASYSDLAAGYAAARAAGPCGADAEWAACRVAASTYEDERATQARDLDRLFLGVVTDAEGVATGCPVEIPTTPHAVPLSDCLEDRCDLTA